MIWILLLIYQIKHFICDYLLQNKYMLGKFKSRLDWILPLLAHVAVHGIATFLIVLVCRPNYALYAALFDMTVHFIIDRIKASPKLLGRYEALSKREMNDICLYLPTLRNNAKQLFENRLKSNVRFWWCLGLDQAMHHLTHYIIIWMII